MARKYLIEKDHYIEIRKGFKAQRNWAVFLDRDGVINREKHLVYKIKDLQIYPFVFKAIKLLNKKKIPVVIIHNASVVARGLCSLNKVIKINKYLQKELNKKGSYVDVILFCPHHPSAFNSLMRFNCQWRKPKTGMLDFVAKKFGIELKKSYVIGDMGRDILLAKKAGAQAILVKTGHQGRDEIYPARAKIIKKNILKAVEYVIKEKKL